MEWRRIEILNKFYMISENGDLYDLHTSRIATHSVNQHGYHRYTFRRRKLNKQWKEAKHRLVAKTFVSNPHNYKEVNHLDGNKENNNYLNLEWCSRSRNVKHSFDINLRNHRGINNPSYKKKLKKSE